MTPDEAFISETPDMNLEWGPVELYFKPGFFIQTAIRSEEAFELCNLAKGKDVLEVGSAHGYSAIIMAEAGARVVYSIDDHNGQTQLGDTLTSLTGNLEACGVKEKVEIMIANSKTGLTHLIEGGHDFDLVFLDGGQAYEEVRTEIALALPLLVFRNGTLAIHDYGHPNYPEKKKAIDKFFPQGPDKLVTTLFVKHLI